MMIDPEAVLPGPQNTNWINIASYSKDTAAEKEFFIERQVKGNLKPVRTYVTPEMAMAICLLINHKAMKAIASKSKGDPTFVSALLKAQHLACSLVNSYVNEIIVFNDLVPSGDD